MGLVTAGLLAGAAYAALPVELGARQYKPQWPPIHCAADLPSDVGAGRARSTVALESSRRAASRSATRLEFVDMDTFRIDQDLFRSIPADLMLRYGVRAAPARRQARSSSSCRIRAICR